MVDTFSPGLRLRKPEVAANEDVWAPLLNDDMITLLETGIAGLTTVDTTGGGVVLTQNDGAPDQSRAMFLRVIGTPGALQIVTLPALTKLYVVINDSDFQVAISESGFPGQLIDSGQVTTVHCEAGDRTREVQQFGESVDDPGLVNSTFTFNVPAANGGAGTTVAVEYLVQGNFVYLNIAPMTDINFNSTLMDLVISAGVIPVEIKPSEEQAIPVSFWEDTAADFLYIQSQLIIDPIDTTTWIIRQINGAVYTMNSDRSWRYGITAVYPLNDIL